MIWRFLLGWVALALLVLVGGVIGFWLYTRIIAGLTLTDQPGTLIFPPRLRAITEATNKIGIQLNGYIDATVPFKQNLDLPLKGQYDADVVLDTEVPIRFTVVYKGAIPIDTIADVQGTTDFVYQKVKRFRNVSFKVKLPLKFEQPVNFTVPVDTRMRFVYRGPLRLALNQTVTAPIDTVLKTRLFTKKSIETPLLAKFGLNLIPPRTPIPVIVKHADLKLRVGRLRFEKAPDPSQPQRTVAAAAPSTP